MEPVGRNTGPALGLAALVALKRDPEALIVSLHSDHYIKKESRFLTVLQNGIKLAKKGRIVTLGITPTYPETGYGYIESFDKMKNNISSSKIKNKIFSEYIVVSF